ncbi:hypothetical protein [Blastococcus sp. SYSU DS0973]
MMVEHRPGEHVVRWLIEARESNPTGVYDEVFADVSTRISTSGSAGKSDIGALLFWRRLRADTRWVAALNHVADWDVREVTASAVAAARDNSAEVPEAAAVARRAPAVLPGFASGDALASALIAASAPERMAVYDRRAHAALRDAIGRDIGRRSGRYRRYMDEVDDLLAHIRPHRPHWTARDVDRALYGLGGRGPAVPPT